MTDPVLIAVSRDASGALTLRTGDGRTFDCSTPAELWEDLAQLADTHRDGSRALCRAELRSRSRHHRARAQVIEPTAEPTEGEKVSAGLEQCADVLEEACAQEFGSIGRMFAQAARNAAPTAARQIQSTFGRKRRPWR